MDSVSPVKERSKGRKYGFACLLCRRRKIKCDGQKPACVNCSRSNETCVYKENPAFVRHLADGLQKSQARVQELESQLKELAILDSDSRDLRLAALASGLDQRQDVSSPDSPAFIHVPESTEVESICYDGRAEFSVDEDGRQYFGATSRFHSLPEGTGLTENELGANKIALSEIEAYHRKWHMSNARFQASWERIANANIPRYTDVDPTLCSALLEVYWAWQAPLHNCVYRRCFFRDMALGGPYFSLFLLNVIFAHACRHMPDDDTRFAPFDRGEFFLEKARLLLLDEIRESKPKIPTIQGLLILGGRQCAVGKSSEGWLYTGMAIRMITDLGLHLDKGRMTMMKQCEPDDLEVRKRLYLSVYAWDKSISLCLGRPPSLQDLPYAPSTLYDVADDEDKWQPPRVLETDKIFPATKCYNTLTFKYFCDLSQIINESYNTVYNGTTDNIQPNSIFILEKKLRTFHKNLPGCLRIENSTDVDYCVPPHILCLNMLYHTMLILIFRPFFIWRWLSKLRDHSLALRAQAVCTEQAAAVNELFRTYGRLFNFQYQSYLISYCVYTAATIDVRLMRLDDRKVAEKAADRLVITLRMLETEVKQTPGIKRSINIIRSHLDQQLLSEPRSCISCGGGSTQEERDSCHQENSNTWSRNSLSANVSLSTSRSQQGQTMSSSSFPVIQQYQSQQTEIYEPSVHNSVAVPQTSSRLPQGNNSGMDAFIDTSMQQINMEWMDWNFDDSGGGFVPDMAYWGAI